MTADNRELINQNITIDVIHVILRLVQPRDSLILLSEVSGVDMLQGSTNAGTSPPYLSVNAAHHSLTFPSELNRFSFTLLLLKGILLPVDLFIRVSQS